MSCRVYLSWYCSSYHYTIWTTFAQYQPTEPDWTSTEQFHFIASNVWSYCLKSIIGTFSHIFPLVNLSNPRLCISNMDIIANWCTWIASLCWRSQLKFFPNRDQQLKWWFAYKLTQIINMFNLILLLVVLYFNKILNKYIILSVC